MVAVAVVVVVVGVGAGRVVGVVAVVAVLVVVVSPLGLHRLGVPCPCPWVVGTRFPSVVVLQCRSCSLAGSLVSTMWRLQALVSRGQCVLVVERGSQGWPLGSGPVVCSVVPLRVFR